MAVDRTGKVLKQDASPQAAIQAALDANGGSPGNVYVQAGDYQLKAPQDPVTKKSTLISLDVHSFTNLILDHGARLIVPTGAAGSVITLIARDGAHAGPPSLGVANTTISGGHIFETTTKAAPAQGRWTAFLLSAEANDSRGNQFNKIRDTMVYNPGVGIALNVQGTGGYINSNTFEFLRIWGGRKFIRFDLDPNSKVVQGNSQIMCNLFNNVHCECQSPDPNQPWVQTEAGIANVVGEKCTFIEVNVWDIQRAAAHAVSLDITGRALNTFVVGGLYQVINNAGKSTVMVGPQL